MLGGLARSHRLLVPFKKSAGKRWDHNARYLHFWQRRREFHVQHWTKSPNPMLNAPNPTRQGERIEMPSTVESFHLAA